LNSIEADASGSKNSATASLFLSGSRQFPRGWLQYLRWSLGYRYENLPGDKLALQSGRGVLSLLGASRASGSLGVITRFGLSLEGGNAQSNLLVPSSPYGALKSYAGLTFNLGRQAFAGSYGIQFGSGSSRPAWDYTKHLANVSYSTRILKEEHKPLTLDLQAGAGYIPGSAALVPIADRFFGGNVERNFIEGDSWHLPRSPMIRSFAESEFGRAGIGGGIGGRDFYSFNATIAQTVMARAVVPQSLTDDPSFRRKLGGQVANARSADKLTYLAESPMFTKILQELSKAEPLLTRAAQLSADLRTAMAANSAMISNLNGLDAAITGANSAIASARKTRMTGLAQVRTLAVGFLQPGETDNCAALVPSLVTQFVCAAQTLVAAAPGNATIAELAAIAKQLTPLRDDWAKAYLALRQQAYLTPADSAKVQAKLNQIAALLGQVFAVAQSPVLLADLKEVCGSFQTSNCEALRNVDPEAVSNTGDWLAIGTGELTPPFLTTIAADAEPLLKPRAEQIRQLAAELKSTMDSLHRPPVELRAIRDTKFTGRLLDVIFRELNLYSIAPFAMFDAARIGGTGSPAFDKLRYAAGPGVRFSVVNFNVNVGYALNINKQPGERFGSIYFSLNVSDLFR
jgi:hypothetical protein